jgi:hypothetical protein
MFPTCLCFILHIRNKFPIPLCLKTHDINDCGFSPILSTYLFKTYCCYICHRAINSKVNRLHIRCEITSTSFQSITTFIYLEVQILTAFPFHSLHHVALRIALTSITCLPLQGLPTVNSVCPLKN